MDKPIDMSQAKRLVTQLRDELARVRIERDTQAYGLRLANEHRAEQDAKIAELQREHEEVYGTIMRLSDLLRDTANALKGPPPKLMLHSWHDLPEWASAARAAADAGASLDAGTDYSVAEHEEQVAMVRAWPRRLAKDARETDAALALCKAAQSAGAPE
jgi:L-fucose isomerase-like protein